MDNLSVFGPNWEIISEPSRDEVLDIALEIRSFKIDGTPLQTSEAKDVLYIYDRYIRRIFTQALLFIDADFAFISKHNGIDEEIIGYYKDIFFDTSMFRGSIAKAEYIEDLKAYGNGTDEHTVGTILEEALIGGRQIVLDQFNIDVAQEGTEGYKDTIVRKAIIDLMIEEKAGTMLTCKARMDARSTVMKLIGSNATSTAHAGASSMESLIKAVQELNAPEYGIVEMELPYFNQELDELEGVIEVVELVETEETVIELTIEEQGE